MLYRIGLEHPHSTTRERPTKVLLVHYLANFTREQLQTIVLQLVSAVPNDWSDSGERGPSIHVDQLY